MLRVQVRRHEGALPSVCKFAGMQARRHEGAGAPCASLPARERCVQVRRHEGGLPVYAQPLLGAMDGPRDKMSTGGCWQAARGEAVGVFWGFIRSGECPGVVHCSALASSTTEQSRWQFPHAWEETRAPSFLPVEPSFLSRHAGSCKGGIERLLRARSSKSESFTPYPRPDVIRKEAWPFYRTISGVRLCWELEKPEGPKG